MAKDSETLVIIEKNAETTLSPQLAREAERAAAYAARRHADATHRAYARARRRFSAWCASRNVDPAVATPELVAIYLSSMADSGLGVSSIVQAYAAIAGRLAEIMPETWVQGHQPLAVARVLRGIRRDSRRPVDRKRPLTRSWLLKALATMAEDTPRNIRDRAILLVGFAGAFRRSEVVALDVDSLRFDPEGVTIRLRDKTHQEKDYFKGVPRDPESPCCPVAALERWLRGAKIATGAVFRRLAGSVVLETRLEAQYVARLVKRVVRAAGGNAREFSGHSLRAGFMTQGALDGWDLEVLMKQSGHRSVEQAREYVRRETVFQHNAAATITSGKRREPP